MSGSFSAQSEQQDLKPEQGSTGVAEAKEMPFNSIAIAVTNSDRDDILIKHLRSRGNSAAVAVIAVEAGTLIRT